MVMRILRCAIIVLIVFASATQVAAQPNIRARLPEWKAAVESVDVNKLDVRYRHGKVVERWRTACLQSIGLVDRDLRAGAEHSLANQVSLYSSMESASNCIGNLSGILNDSSISGESAYSAQLAKKLETRYEEASELTSELLNNLLARVQDADKRLASCGIPHPPSPPSR
jgi:hypothetical protein